VRAGQILGTASKLVTTLVPFVKRHIRCLVQDEPGLTVQVTSVCSTGQHRTQPTSHRSVNAQLVTRHGNQQQHSITAPNTSPFRTVPQSRDSTSMNSPCTHACQHMPSSSQLAQLQRQLLAAIAFKAGGIGCSHRNAQPSTSQHTHDAAPISNNSCGIIVSV
jgi:hypothetical protein